MALDNLRSLAMALVMTTLLIAAGALTLAEFREDIVTDLPSSTVVNETVSLTNGTALANNWVSGITIIEVNDDDATANGTLESAEYTITNLNSDLEPTITILNTTRDGNTSYWTYTYYDDDASYQGNVTREGLLGTSNASSFLSTIGTLIGVAALIMVVVGAFYLARR